MSWFYSINESISALKKSWISSFLSISSMAVSLFFLGVFMITIFHGWKLVRHLKSQIEMEVFLKDGINNELLKSIRLKLEPMEEIDTLIYISKEKALAGFQKEIGNEEIVDLLGENPLPASFRIRLKEAYHNKENVAKMQKKIEKWAGVDEVLYRYDLLDAIMKYLKTIILVAFFLGGTLVIASILLISNTVRLSISTKRDSIKIMNLVGATPGFIRRPFIFAGAIQGASGAFVAIIALFFLAKIVGFFLPEIKLHFVYVYLGLLIWGIFLGSMGSWIAMHRYLRL
ncbi:MAG TPA: ABC transporter permease [Bacteroidetes bacterium]|nr:ABC transporter permease [Bacteroidota bacterium]